VTTSVRPPDGPEASVGRAQAAVAAAERGLVHAQSRVPGVAAAIESFEREQRRGAGLLAGGIAYRLFFWTVAFGVVIAGIASFWVHASRNSLEDVAKTFGLGAVAAQSATSAFQTEAHSRWYFLVAGTALLLYFGLAVVRALRVASFLAWDLPPRRLARAPRAALGFTLLLSSVMAVSAGSSWFRHHGRATGLVATIALLAVYAAIGVFALGLLPRPEETTWRTLLPGAILFSLGNGAMHLFVVYYLAAKLERSPELYGSLGAATVVLLWLYLAARIIVSGLFLNATIWSRRG
jgi:uncharacterized BrkB/YihY/UPF0761 family membrane protein